MFPPACRLPRSIGVACAAVVAVMMMPTAALAAQGPVDLATASSFAVLAGSGITNTGATTIDGDVGTFPTPSETGFNSLTLAGDNHDGDAVTQSAKTDLDSAYTDASGRTPSTSLPTELGGSTLLPGVYSSPTFGLTGTLTLNAQGDDSAQFIFQAGSTLITASNSHVVLINGAQGCNVVWQVGSSATFGTGTGFTGDVLAASSITAGTDSTFSGRLLAETGAVTLDTNTITKPTCAAVSPSPSPSPSTSLSPTPTGSPSSSVSANPSPSPSSTISTTATASPTPSTSGTSSAPHPKASATRHSSYPGSHGSGPGGPSPELPVTGGPTGWLIGAGLGLVISGGLVSSRMRRDHRGAGAS